MAIAVRRLEVNDARAAIELLQRFKPSVGFDLTAMQGFLSKSGNILLECTLDGEPAGFALGYVLQRSDGRPPMLFLYEIEVLESHRRRGLARTMIEKLKAGADGKFFVVTQRSNRAAIGLYTAAGGRQLHPDDVLFAFDTEASDPPVSA